MAGAAVAGDATGDGGGAACGCGGGGAAGTGAGLTADSWRIDRIATNPTPAAATRSDVPSAIHQRRFPLVLAASDSPAIVVLDIGGAMRGSEEIDPDHRLVGDTGCPSALITLSAAA